MYIILTFLFFIFLNKIIYEKKIISFDWLYIIYAKADEDWNIIISIYNSDTKEYIFIKPKN